MAENSYTGAVDMDAGNGETWTILFDYNALAAIRTAIGADPFRALAESDFDPFVQVLAIGSGRTVEEVNKASPPLVAAQEAVNRALTFAYFGADGPPDEPEPEPEGGKKKKKQ